MVEAREGQRGLGRATSPPMEDAMETMLEAREYCPPAYDVTGGVPPKEGKAALKAAAPAACRCAAVPPKMPRPPTPLPSGEGAVWKVAGVSPTC